MKRIIITAISFLFVCLCCFAQDINGLDLNKKRTKSEFITLFGKPIQYHKSTPDAGDDPFELGYVETYKFEGIYFEYAEKWGIYSYSVISPEYHVLTNIVDADGVKLETTYLN